MNAKEVLLLSLEQSQGYLVKALDGLTQAEIAWSPNAESNSIAFILWHMTRVEDYYVTRVIQRLPEVYEAEGWREKLGTPVKNTGFEYNAEQLKSWPVPPLEILRGYANAVRGKTLAFLESIPPEKLAEPYRPERSPQDSGTLLARIFTEIALHVGQICYLRGIQRGLDK